MADNFVVNPASGGVTFASDDIGNIHHQRVKVQHGADGSATDVSDAAPLPVLPVFESPQTTYAQAVSIAPGSSSDLDSDQITSGKTGELVAVRLSAAVPMKAELYTVTNAVASSVLDIFFINTETVTFEMPSKKFFTVAQDAGAGFDGFRIVATNNDTGAQASDLHATFLYDEVT